MCSGPGIILLFRRESSTVYCQPHTHTLCSSSISTHGTLGCAPEFSSTQKKLISLKTLRAILREEIRVYSESYCIPGTIISLQEYQNRIQQSPKNAVTCIRPNLDIVPMQSKYRNGTGATIVHLGLGGESDIRTVCVCTNTTPCFISVRKKKISRSHQELCPKDHLVLTRPEAVS